MKLTTKVTSILITMVLAAGCGAMIAKAQDRDVGSCTTIILSECFQLPTFTPAKMPRIGYDMYFDYGYRVKQDLVIACPGAFGGQVQTKEYTRLENRVQPFRMAELGHEDIDLIRQVQAFIATKQAFACE